MSKLIIGQIYRIKNESRNNCSAFCSSRTVKKIRLTSIERGLKYDILDENDVKVNDCYGCFTESDLVLTKDFNSLEIGDVIDCGDGNERTVLSVLPSVPDNTIYIISWDTDAKRTDEILSAYEIQGVGWKIKGEPTEEVKEMTVEAISKILGFSVKIVKE